MAQRERQAWTLILGACLLGVLLSAWMFPALELSALSLPDSPVPAAPVTVQFPVVADALIDSALPDRNYGVAGGLLAGPDSLNGTIYRSLLDFNVSGIPSTAIVVNATLRAHASSATAITAFDVHRVRAPWTEGSGSQFTYRRNLTVTETAGVSRLREPVDILFVLTTPIPTTVAADFRVYDDQGNEVPSQVYGATYAGPAVTSVHIVFAATVGASQSRVYSVYYGNTLPTIPAFRAKTPWAQLWSRPGGSAYAPLSAADLNGDGRLEVVYGSPDGGIYAYEWNGSLLWRRPAPDVVDFATTVVDVNGDGDLEVVFAATGNIDRRIYAMDAATGTYDWVTNALPANEANAPLAISDVDGDGVMEVFVGATDRYLYAFNGTDGSQRWSILLPGAGWGYGAAVGNVAEDGAPEIVYTTSAGSFYIVRRDGSVVRTVSPGFNSAIVTPSLGDMDGDGVLDIVAGDGSNNGNEFAFRGDGSTVWIYSSTSNQYGGQILVDFEDDGALETVFAMTRRDSVRVLDNLGNSRWAFPTLGIIQGTPAAADVNLDGVEDILIGSFDGSLYVIDSGGNQIRSFAAPDEVTATPIVADLDGDGTLEIVFASRTRVFAYSTASLGHDFRTGGYNYNVTGRFLDGNSPNGAPLVATSFGLVENLGGSGVTWRTRDGVVLWANSGADYAAVAASATVSSVGQWVTWNVTSLVQSWTNGSQPDLGVLLKTSTESGSARAGFVSREGEPALRAVLEVTYRDNRAPIITSQVPNQQAIEDGPLWNVDLAGFTSDPDTTPDRLRWDLGGVDASLYDHSGGNVTGNHRLSFVPKPNAFGNDAVTLFLFDDQGNFDSQPLWVNITPVNDRPLWNNPPTTLYVKYGTSFTFDFAPYVEDIDTPFANLRLRADDLVHTSVSGFRVTFTYPANYPDPWDFVVLTVDDGFLSSAESIAIRLTTDTPPELRSFLPDVTLTEGQTRLAVFDLDDYFFDADGDVLFYSYGQAQVGVTIHDRDPQPLNHSVDMSALGEWWGVESITFRARDTTGALIEDTILVTVIPANDPPILQATPPYVVHYDAPYLFDLLPYVSDPDNTITQLTITTSLPEISVQGTVMTMLFPRLRGVLVAPYTLPLTIFVSDGIDTAFRVTTVTVGDDYPPELRNGTQLPDVTYFEDETLPNAFDLDDYFIDADSGTIFYFSGPIDVQVTIDAFAHTVSFSSQANWFGSELVTFRATDDRGAYAEDTIKVTVRPVNDAPYFLPLSPVQSAGRTFFFNIRDYVDDVDNNKSDLQISSASGYVTIQAFLLVFTYPEGVFEDQIDLTVSDGTATGSGSLRIEIERPNLFLALLPWLAAAAGIAAVLVATRVLRSTVEEVFLIAKSGVPLVHLSRTLTSDKDPDLIASMFTAIQSFMNQSFGSMGVGDLKNIELADHNMAVARGTHVILALLYRGRESKRLERRAADVVEEIESKFNDVLRDWNGDVDRLTGVKQVLEKLWGAKDSGGLIQSFTRQKEEPPRA